MKAAALMLGAALMFGAAGTASAQDTTGKSQASPNSTNTDSGATKRPGGNSPELGQERDTTGENTPLGSVGERNPDTPRQGSHEHSQEKQEQQQQQQR